MRLPPEELGSVNLFFGVKIIYRGLDEDRESWRTPPDNYTINDVLRTAKLHPDNDLPVIELILASNPTAVIDDGDGHYTPPICFPNTDVVFSEPVTIRVNVIHRVTGILDSMEVYPHATASIMKRLIGSKFLWNTPKGPSMADDIMLPVPDTNIYTVHLFVGGHKRRILDTLPLAPFFMLDGARCVQDLTDITLFYDLTPIRDNPYPNHAGLERWDEVAGVAFSVLGSRIDHASIGLYLQSAPANDKRRMFLLDVIQKLQGNHTKTASPVIETLANLARWGDVMAFLCLFEIDLY